MPVKIVSPYNIDRYIKNPYKLLKYILYYGKNLKVGIHALVSIEYAGPAWHAHFIQCASLRFRIL